MENLFVFKVKVDGPSDSKWTVVNRTGLAEIL